MRFSGKLTVDSAANTGTQQQPSITGNDFSGGDPADANDVIVGASGSAAGHTFRLPGYVGATLDDVQNFIKGNNLNAGTTAVTAYTDPPVTQTAFVGGASCPTPP